MEARFFFWARALADFIGCKPIKIFVGSLFFSSKTMDTFCSMREGSIMSVSRALISSAIALSDRPLRILRNDLTFFSGITIFRRVLDAHRVKCIFEPICEVPIYWKQARCLEELLSTLNCDLMKS